MSDSLAGSPTPDKADFNLVQTLWYSVANFGFGCFYGLNNAIISLFLGRFTKNAVIIGLMASSHSFEGVLIQPVVGAMSDRCMSRLGRRRPFILLCIPVSVLFMLLTPVAATLPANVRLIALIVCICLFTATFNVANDPYQSLMPDITPPDHRGRVTGLWTLIGVLGQAMILLLPLPIEMKIEITAVTMLFATLITCWKVREKPLQDEPKGSHVHWFQLREALRGISTLGQARLALLIYFFYGLGVGAVLPFLTTYVHIIAHATDQQAENMFLVLMVFTAIAILPCGRYTDKVGASRMLQAGLFLVLIAAIAGAVASTLPQIAAAMALAGVGNAALSASAYPLLTLLVPAREIGIYTGLQTAAASIAQPLTVAVTGVLTNDGGYRYIFVVCCVGVLIAMLLLTRLRPETAGAEIAARELELGL